MHTPAETTRKPAMPGNNRPSTFDLLVLLALLVYVARHLHPSLWFTDTMTVGGDTPAHHYLASHLKEQFFGHGRIVSWAQGWWAGFPMFQYYFYLPYLMMAALSYLIPSNVAFKVISILGILMLPGCTYTAARMLKLPRPIPILGAIATVPFLFVSTHLMWGANIYSTLAGMIANSISFPIMLLALGSAYRDASDGIFRLRTPILLFLLLSSHFFTTIIAVLVILMIPVVMPLGRKWQACLALAPSGVLMALTTAWWTLPLVARRDFSVAFGTNWNVPLYDTLPAYTLLLIPFILYALWHARNGRTPAVFLLGWMLAAGAGLFFFGDHLAAVFVNVRLWPFVFFAMLMLAACGLGFAVRACRGKPLLVAAVTIICLLQVSRQQQDESAGTPAVRNWAEFNFSGIEARPGYRAFQDLVLPLDGTPGRLAYDLTALNNSMGSSRIFECVPHLIHKAIIEGGLVNSGLSSYFTYYGQCEMSRNCAGYPTLMSPTTFLLENGTRHMALFNVKHFIAREPQVRLALRDSPDWQLMKSSGAWDLFELTTHQGHTVVIPPNEPRAVYTESWKQSALEWMYTIDAIGQPFVFLNPGETFANSQLNKPIPPEAFRRYIRSLRQPQSDIDEWLHLGPFHYKPGENGLGWTPLAIQEAELNPQAGEQIAGRKWTLLFSRPPIFPGRYYRNPHYLVAYSFVNLFTPIERDALIHFANDDGARLYLNGKKIAETGFTGLDNFEQRRVHLKAGRNRLLHKTEEIEGGHFFHVRITDLEGLPIPDLTYSILRTPPKDKPMVPRPVHVQGQGVLSETIAEDRIRFTTDAIGQPHIIKCSFYPNWKVHGARQVYLVSPAFMLVYPEQREVELVYTRLPADRIGMALSGLGWLLVVGHYLWRRKQRHPAA